MYTFNKRNRLYKPKNLVIRKVDEFYLGLNPDVPNIVVMDEVGKRFFELCDGSLAAKDIIEKILEEQKNESLRKELFTFINSMINANFLFLNPPQPPQKIERATQRLRELYFHITRACNLRCKHCYLNAGVPMENELTTLEVLKMIENFAQLGGEQLIITGGEPFLRRRLLHKVFKKAREQRIKRTFVETNGTLILDHDIDVCKKYNVELGVSLDGAVPETNDYIRGKGNYIKTVTTLKKLVDAGVKVKINMTLMKPNYKEVEKIVSLAKDLGVNSISLTVLMEVGRAESNKNLSLSFNETLSAIISMWRKAREVGVRTHIEDQFKSFEKLTKTDICDVGRGLLLVSSNGDVYPCHMFLDFPEFKAGNIRNQPLENIWMYSETLKVFRTLSVLDIEGCRECELKFICSVCPAEIYREHRNFSKKSHICSLYRKICWVLIEDLARKMWAECI